MLNVHFEACVFGIPTFIFVLCVFWDKVYNVVSFSTAILQIFNYSNYLKPMCMEFENEGMGSDCCHFIFPQTQMYSMLSE